MRVISLNKLLLTNARVSKLRKAFSNGSSANMKLSKTQLHEIGQWGGFIGRLLRPLLKTALPLMKNVLKSLARNLLVPLGLIAAASATDAAIHRKMFGLGTTALIVSNEEMSNIMKIILAKQLKWNKWKKRGFLGMLLVTLDVSLLENLLTGKGRIRADEETSRTGQSF